MLWPVLSQNADVILPDYNEFTGFVFKLQANLDPRHRDRLAYVRVVSGRYEKGMKARGHFSAELFAAGRSAVTEWCTIKLGLITLRSSTHK